MCFLAALLCVGGPVSAASKEQATQAQLATLKKSIRSAQARLKKDRSALSKEAAALKSLEARIGDTGKAVYRLNQKLAGLRGNLTGYEADKARIEKNLALGQAALHEAIREQYKRGQQPRLLMLLNQRDPDELSRMMKYYDYFNSAQQQQLLEYRKMLTALEQTNANIDSTQAAIVAERDALQSKLAEQEEQRKARKQALAALRKKVGQGKTKVAQLKKDQKQLEKLLVEIEKSVSLAKLSVNNQAFKSLKGKLKAPVSGRVKRRFGSLDQGIRYDGVMFGAALGASVSAVHHGRVVFSDALRGYGLVTIIDHGDGYHTLYGHNDSLLKSQGDWVEQGETIATVGFSGGNSEPGLYFAIRYKGKATNPQRWLARK